MLTIGNFDGVHLGHQRIIQTARSVADAEGLPVVAMTFEPPPDAALRPEHLPRRITPPEARTRLLLEAGCDYVVIVPVDRELLTTTAENFIQQIVVKRFAPKHIVEGANFFFGRQRSGTVETLSEAAPAGGFEMHLVEPVTVELPQGRSRIASTLIRSLIEAGHVADAARCLGRQFALFGRVVPGSGLGRQLGFPTINLELSEQACPADGVYAGKALLPAGQYPAAVSIGANPTLAVERRTVEAFLIDAQGDFYDQQAALHFLQRIRDQKRFDDIESLKDQIAKDVQRVRETLQ